MNCINAIGSNMYTVLGNGNKKVHHSRSFSCDMKYFICVFLSEVSHGTSQLYTFTLFHSVLLHVTKHKFWVVYLFVRYSSDISPLKRSLLFVMFLCMAKMSTGFCIANDMKVPRMITLTLHCARCSEYFWTEKKMWIVHTINFRRKSVFDPVNYSRSKKLCK